MTPRRRLSPILLLLLPLATGCAHSPAFNILGSFFPGWIACIVAGILLTVILRAILHHIDFERQIKALPLVYISLALLFACTLWLIFFE
jgi:hypothetical protein